MNPILKQFLFISSIYLLAPSTSAFSLNEPLTSEVPELASPTEASGETGPLLGQLQEQLGITSAQAAGGTGALLQLARNQLGTKSVRALTSQASSLSGLMGGDSRLLSGITSMSGVESAFSALGMDSAMVSRFVPIVMSFLGSQGIDSSLLGQLQGLWAS